MRLLLATYNEIKYPRFLPIKTSHALPENLKSYFTSKCIQKRFTIEVHGDTLRTILQVLTHTIICTGTQLQLLKEHHRLVSEYLLRQPNAVNLRIIAHC